VTFDYPVSAPVTTATTTTTATSPVPTTASDSDFYTVVGGDTLFGIARKLNVEVSALLAANGLDETSMLVPGQVLIVPPGEPVPNGSVPGEPVPSGSMRAAATCQAPDSQEANGTPIVFHPQNVLDGDPSTVWRCAAPATGETLTVTLDSATTLTSVGMIGGYSKIDPLTGVDRWPQNHRVRRVQWTFSDGTTVEQELADSPEMQSIEVDVTTTSVTIEIQATYAATGTDPKQTVAIAELLVATG